jgi:hypothetical protein
MPIRPVYQNVCRPLLCCIAIRSPGNCKLSQFVPPAVTREKKTHHCSLFGISSGHSPFSKQYQYSVAISDVSDLYSEDMQFESLPEHEPLWLIFHGFKSMLEYPSSPSVRVFLIHRLLIILSSSYACLCVRGCARVCVYVQQSKCWWNVV